MQANAFRHKPPKSQTCKKIWRKNMKKFKISFLALSTLALLSTSTGCSGTAGGSDDDASPVAESTSPAGNPASTPTVAVSVPVAISNGEQATPVAEAPVSESNSAESVAGSAPESESTDLGTSLPAGFVAVPGATFDGSTTVCSPRCCFQPWSLLQSVHCKTHYNHSKPLGMRPRGNAG